MLDLNVTVAHSDKYALEETLRLNDAVLETYALLDFVDRSDFDGVNVLIPLDVILVSGVIDELVEVERLIPAVFETVLVKAIVSDGHRAVAEIERELTALKDTFSGVMVMVTVDDCDGDNTAEREGEVVILAEALALIEASNERVALELGAAERELLGLELTERVFRGVAEPDEENNADKDLTTLFEALAHEEAL